MFLAVVTAVLTVTAPRMGIFRHTGTAARETDRAAQRYQGQPSGRLPRPVILALVVGLLGGALWLMDLVSAALGLGLEEAVGLRALFALRGPATPPANVTVVSLDRRSAHDLALPYRVYRWNRAVHANLVRALTARGATVIVYDVFFGEKGDADGDLELAGALAAANRVILSQSAHREQQAGLLLTELLDPEEGFVHSARALAPFPLPKVPSRVSQFWAFFSAASDTPTLPVVALQLQLLQSLGERRTVALLTHLGLLEKADPAIAVAGSLDVTRLIKRLRMRLRSDPRLAERSLRRIHAGQMPSELPAETVPLLSALLRTCAGPSSEYLNFYGAAGTISTLPLSAVIEGDGRVRPNVDVAGKVVFVGEGTTAGSAQTDGFNTVFTRADGVNLSGVEIAATAYANLRAQRTLRPLTASQGLLFLFLVGLLAACAAVMIPPRGAVLAILALAIGHLALAQTLFVREQLWLPLVIPLAVQLPLALFGGLFWQFRSTSRERELARQAIRYYVPERVATRIDKAGQPTTAIDLVYATCLATDIANYTTVSEQLPPEAIVRLTNDYFAALGECITANGGELLDIVGDGMTCAWPAEAPERTSRVRACEAALQIVLAVQRFNDRHPSTPLPTRLGLNAGWAAMGNVGGGGHFDYALIGDIVNTASRIEGLNKVLGTQVLAAQPVTEGLSEFVVRPLGRFLFKGKSRPVSIVELLAHAASDNDRQGALCERFGRALAAFDLRHWDSAARQFEAILACHPTDGPSRFFVAQCERYQRAPPPGTGPPIIHLPTK